MVEGTYEKNAGKYAERWAGYPFVAELDAIIKAVNARARVLELGCGVGQNCNYLQERGFDVVGIDVSEAVLHEAGKKFPKAKFEKKDARKLEFAEESFDAVFAIGLFHHLNVDEQVKVVSEIKRVLKKNGVAFVAAKTSKENAEKQLSELKKLFEENGFAVSSAYVDEKNMASEEHKQKFVNVLARTV
ncbi:class I SAM-dependent methyltransferase [Candidatus Micrarchaeota archaeon]|nr:class I SAM-dependent methyltransferase [Candidatus Micrarchaeota archaeon]